MKKILYFFSFLMLFVTACKKDKPEPTPTPTNITGVYTITGLKAKGSNSQQVDLYDQLTECQQNDTWDFQEDGTFRYGGVATNECQSEDLSGTWSLNGKTFTITTEQNSTAYQMESFNGQNLVLSISGTVNGEQATFFVTYTKR